MLVPIDGSGPLFQRVYEGLRTAILRGDLPRDSRLPSTRALAEDLGVSRTTVLLAYEQLLAEGYVSGRAGSGTYVASDIPDQRVGTPPSEKTVNEAVEPPKLSAFASRIGGVDMVPPVPSIPVRFDFQYGTPAVEDFPHDVWRRLLARRARSVSLRSLRYGRPEGLPQLRQAIAAYVTQSRGVRCTPDRVVIVNGSQQALDLAARLTLDPGDGVLIEEPHYQGARKVFLAAGARLVPVGVDADGLEVDRIPAASSGIRLAYVTPSHQFPSGATLTLARRLKLLAWASETDAYVIEDDYDSEYRYEGRPVESMQGLDSSGRVIYVGTFSKVLFPSLRIGYVVLPEPLVGPFVAAKWMTDRHTPTVEQETLADFITEGHFERHLRRGRTRYAARRIALLAALDERFGDRVEVRGANAGIHLIAWFRDIAPALVPSIVARARHAGVGVYSATPYYLGEPPAAGLLLGYAHLLDRDIAAGIGILADVIDRELENAGGAT